MSMDQIQEYRRPLSPVGESPVSPACGASKCPSLGAEGQKPGKENLSSSFFSLQTEDPLRWAGPGRRPTLPRLASFQRPPAQPVRRGQPPGPPGPPQLPAASLRPQSVSRRAAQAPHQELRGATASGRREAGWREAGRRGGVQRSTGGDRLLLQAIQVQNSMKKTQQRSCRQERRTGFTGRVFGQISPCVVSEKLLTVYRLVWPPRPIFPVQV